MGMMTVNTTVLNRNIWNYLKYHGPQFYWMSYVAITAQELTAAIEQAIAHHCAHLDGVQFWLTQLNQPDPAFASIDLGDHQLQGIGEQPLQLAMYDTLVGGNG